MSRDYEGHRTYLGESQVVMRYKSVMIFDRSSHRVWLKPDEALLLLDWLTTHKDELASFAHQPSQPQPHKEPEVTS